MSNQSPKENTNNLQPETVGVKYALTEDLTPNPYNPRRLFDKEPLTELEDSIKKVGILVPLTVYWDSTKFVILDGQRRWICAQNVGLEKVPVNQVAKPTLVQNIVTMFQIHNNREDWELMPTALTLEILMRELGEKSEKKLAILTGLNPTTVSRCKRLLSYSKEHQDLMLDPDRSKRIKADFFILLYDVISDVYVKKMRWFSKNDFINRMLAKYKEGKGIKAVTDFRLIKQYITNARKVNKFWEIETKLEEFTQNDELTLNHLKIEEADSSAIVRKTISDLQKTEFSLKEMDAKDFYGEEELWEILERLLKLINQKLVDAGRRNIK